MRLSAQVFFLYPAIKPSGMASASETSRETPISRMVEGRRRSSMGATGVL